MQPTTFQQRREIEQLDLPALRALQLKRLNALLEHILPQNEFYARKLARVALPLTSFEQLVDLPLTTKQELLGADDSGDWAANLTFPPDRYTRFHRTSGTRGRPLAVLDTADDWRWWIHTWQYVLDAAELNATDRVLAAFSFGPFIGFWSAFDAIASRGAMVVPGGGAGTEARLAMIATAGVTAVCCTPSYALHMAEVAEQRAFDLAGAPVRRLIVAGEPGGSLPAVRDRIESAWNARVIDHVGASEVGPWGYADRARRGQHVIESEYIPEFFAIGGDGPAAPGEPAELVLTNLGRVGSPVIRYRTGDVVRPVWNESGANRFVLLDGGVLGRTDDMMIIRGVNIYPSSIEQILRSFDEVAEFRMTAERRSEMDALTIEVEDRLDDPRRIARRLQVQLGLRVEVQCVPVGSLPRFEGKGQRFVDRR